MSEAEPTVEFEIVDPVSKMEQELVNRGFIVEHGQALVVRGLSEETVAMLFAMYSRSNVGLKTTLAKMIVDGEVALPEFDPQGIDGKTRSFHERVTVGYNHKSVADHATVHWALEGVSMVAERDFLSARLLAATAQSTRYVDFRSAGFVTPEDWPAIVDKDEYESYCSRLIDEYAAMVPMAVEAIRDVEPFDDAVWKHRAWEVATEKRALDMVRDILPSGVRTRFGATCSATALREILDKRQTGAEWQSAEVSKCAEDLRMVGSSALPTLLTDSHRRTPRHLKKTAKWVMEQPNDFTTRRLRRHSVSVVMQPNWHAVQQLTESSIMELIPRWIHERGHHMVPDRTAESAIYGFILTLPFAIHRDLERHRMKTGLDSTLHPAMGYGADPLLLSMMSLAKYPRLRALNSYRDGVIRRVDATLTKWVSSGVPTFAVQYACPMATMVKAKWVVNIRELVHILGLRTTKQGHPSYRSVIQDLAVAVRTVDPIIAPLINEVTDFSDVVVGRPGT
jgi:thymidylate synthase ThyX